MLLPTFARQRHDVMRFSGFALRKIIKYIYILRRAEFHRPSRGNNNRYTCGVRAAIARRTEDSFFVPLFVRVLSPRRCSLAQTRRESAAKLCYNANARPTSSGIVCTRLAFCVSVSGRTVPQNIPFQPKTPVVTLKSP